ncbi:MAG TPA: ABC transporter ATP-binding protein [Planctomycetota bacterium]|nr:ABC transporter ATP-binding protein [Planctomycetota bacterium]
MSSVTEFLHVETVEKVYRTGETDLKVLKGVSLDLAEGEILAIVGPSGSGKSTLLHLMGFLDRPTAGEVSFRGAKLSGMDPGEQAYVRNHKFGFVFQMYHLLPELDALENALVPLMIRAGIFEWFKVGGAHRKHARELLQNLGLGGRLHHRPHQLSGGERQRVAIARALVGDPEIVFCDEPTGNLDAATSREIQELITRLSKETGKTFVIVSHDPAIATLAGRVIKLVDGRITS